MDSPGGRGDPTYLKCPVHNERVYSRWGEASLTASLF